MGQPELNDPELWISAEIEHFLHEFQSIPIRPPGANASVSVHAPYMLLSTSLLDHPDAAHKLKEPNRDRLERVRAARSAAGPDLQALFARYFYDPDGHESSLARGRARLKDIQVFLQEAVDLGLVRSEKLPAQLDDRDLRAWLKRYGIGVDCSGFVQQVLQRLQVKNLAQGNPLALPQAEWDPPLLRCPWVYRMLSGLSPSGFQFFTPVRTLAEARPGDILVNAWHMRILIQTTSTAGSAIVLKLAESTSGIDFPSGYTQEDFDIGPRIIEVQYPQPTEPAAAQIPLRKPETQTDFQADEAESSYLIGRFCFLSSMA